MRLIDRLKDTQYTSTLTKDITTALVLAENGRDLYNMTNVAESVEISITSITNLEGGFYSLSLIGDATYPITFAAGLVNYIDGFIDDTKRNDILFLWNEAIDSSDTSLESRLQKIIITQTDIYVPASNPEISSLTISNSPNDILTIVFDQTVNMADIVGQSILSDGGAISITGIDSGSGTNTLNIQLDRSVLSGEK